MGLKAVITCVNSTIKNALIDVVINRPLVNVNGSIALDPTFLNHTINDMMGCVNKIENKMTNK
jgi:type II secretory pathway component GspD/PulD (secretin)